MRALVGTLLGLALAALGPLAAGCNDACKVSSDCAAGRICDFVSGDCIAGCTRDEDCNQGSCDPRYGVCRARARPPSGADARTSTTASDAGAQD